MVYDFIYAAILHITGIFKYSPSSFCLAEAIGAPAKDSVNCAFKNNDVETIIKPKK